MVKITDVADKAGVSVTTVSRVLNNRGYISQATRDKVYLAMKELDYQPNELARSLFRRKSNMIGLIVPKVSHPFFSELAYYLEDYADKKGYKLLLCNSNGEMHKEKKYIEMLKKNQVDGIIMGSQALEVEDYLNLNLPIISFDRILAENIPLVTSDNFLGGQLASELLISKQCRKVAYIYGGIGGLHHNALLASARYQGFLEELKDTDIEHFTLALETNTAEDHVKEMKNFLREHPEIDGVFASSDVIAAEVIQACQQLKKTIPADIKVIGYDNVAIASLVSPSLTTISQPIQEMCQLTIDLMAKQIAGKEVPLVNRLPVKLIERSTT